MTGSIRDSKNSVALSARDDSARHDHGWERGKVWDDESSISQCMQISGRYPMDSIRSDMQPTFREIVRGKGICLP